MNAMSEENVQRAVVNPGAAEDAVSKTRTIYDVGPMEVFWRNLLAGFARGLGSLVVYVIFIVILGFFFSRFILPQLQPLISSFADSVNTLNALQHSQVMPSSGSPGQTPAPSDLQNLLKNYQF